MRSAAVIVAAGKGTRLGARKQFLPLGGLPIVSWSCRALAAHPDVEHVVVVVPPGSGDWTPERFPGVEVSRCAGGATRRDSAGNGVAALPEWAEIILIHDAARPFVSRQIIDALLKAAATSGAALPTLPLADTIKRVRDGMVAETVDRSDLGRAQTPQAFRADVIRSVHDWARREGASASDDASLCEMRGFEVACVPGDDLNLKITTAADYALAEWLVESGRATVPPLDPDGESGGAI